MKTHVSTFLLPVTLWIIAFICALYPVNELNLQFFAAGITAIFLWGYLFFVRNMEAGWNIPKSPVLLFPALFWLLATASIFWSEIKPVSFTAVCMFSVMPITFFAGALRGDEKLFRTIALSLVPIFFILGVWAVVQYLFLSSYFFGQARHPLQDPSSLGALFSLALFCAMGWMVFDQNKIRKSIALLLSLTLIAGIMATVARGPVFAFIPGLALFVILLWPQIKQAKKYVLVFLIAIIAIGATLNWASGIETITDRVGDTVTLKVDDVTNHRMELWTSTLDMIKQHPFIGTGFGTYMFYFPEYKSEKYAPAAFHAHNDPLEFWAELGIFGPLLFYAFIIAAAVRTFSSLKKLTAGQTKDRVIIVTSFAALVSMVVQSHVNFSLYNISILLVTGLLLGIWYYYTAKVAAVKVINVPLSVNTPRILGLAVLALPFLMVWAIFMSNVAGEYYTNKARDHLFASELNEFADSVNMAAHASYGMNYRSYILAVNVPLTLLEVGKSTLNPFAKKTLYEQADGYMKDVLAINPRSETAYYYLAKAQELAGRDAVPPDTKTVEELYKEALRLDPMHLGARMSLYRLYVKEKRDKKDIYGVLEPAANMYFNTTIASDYYQALAKLYLEDGNYVKVTETMTKMADFQERSELSRKHGETSLPQTLMKQDPLQ